MFKDETGEIVPAIVSEELWEQANAVLKRRSEDVRNRQGICNHANLFTGKLYCTHCGAAYYRKDSVDRKGNKSSKWVCSGKIKNGADSCPSFAIYENEVKPLIFELLQNSDEDADALIDEYVELFKSLAQVDNLAKQIKALEKQIDTAEKKKQKLLTYNAMGELSDKDFLSMNRQCAQELDEAQKELTELTQKRDSDEDFKEHIATIRRVLQDAKKDAAKGVVNKDFVEKYIDRIYVTPESEDSMLLQIKIFTGETTEKYLKNLKGRTGHTFKKMIESYEKGL